LSSAPRIGPFPRSLHRWMPGGCLVVDVRAVAKESSGAGRSSTRSLLPIIGNAYSAFLHLPMGPAISAVCLIGCCNEEITVPNLPTEGETVTNAYLRSITDEDAAVQLRDPVLWAYVLRDPTGAACSHGHGKARKECEQRAIIHAAECTEEAWPESRMWVSSK
jgi:hypothetical protein